MRHWSISAKAPLKVFAAKYIFLTKPGLYVLMIVTSWDRTAQFKNFQITLQYELKGDIEIFLKKSQTYKMLM